MRLGNFIAVLVALAPYVAFAQDNQLAAEGRGLLPAPAAAPETLGGVPPPKPFELDASGTFSRTIFETNEDPNFKITIRDHAFPPSNQAKTITLPAAALVQNQSPHGNVNVANQKLEFAARAAAPQGAPIDVTNNGNRAVVVRTITLEPK